MARGGPRPNSGRKKGSPNRTTLGKAATQAAIAASRVAPLSDFDPLEQLEIIAKQFLSQAAAEQRKGPDAIDRPVFNEHLLNAARVLKDIVPYRHSRLASMEHKFPQFDFSRLTDAQ